MPQLVNSQFQQAGQISGTSLTGTFANLTNGTFNGTVRKLFILSTCNQEVALNFNGGTAEHIIIPGVASVFGIPIDLDTSMVWAGTVSAKHTGVAPTSGKIIVFVVGGS